MLENSPFFRLLGVWKTTGNSKSGQENAAITGIDSYELILDGHYILHKAAVTIGNDQSETFETIKIDNSDKAKMQYFNSKGEEGIMVSSITTNEIHIQGKKLKFAGTINDKNTIITGKWYLYADDGKWIDFMDLKLEKQKDE